MTRHEIGRQASSQIHKDLIDKKLKDEMMDKSAGHLRICLWNKDESFFDNFQSADFDFRVYCIVGFKIE
jgi:hypothetical protein